MRRKKPSLNKYEEDEFQEATECYICEKEFTGDNIKVREHNHLSGKYREQRVNFVIPKKVKQQN